MSVDSFVGRVVVGVTVAVTTALILKKIGVIGR